MNPHLAPYFAAMAGLAGIAIATYLYKTELHFTTLGRFLRHKVVAIDSKRGHDDHTDRMAA